MPDINSFLRAWSWGESVLKAKLLQLDTMTNYVDIKHTVELHIMAILRQDSLAFDAETSVKISAFG